MFSIESVINTQYPALANNHKKFLRPATAFLRTLFHESEVQQFEQRYSHLSGMDFIEQVLGYFDFTYSVSERDLKRIPTYGKIIIVDTEKLKAKKRKRYMGE